ncbi:hypothetical protein F5Y19DRAFT_431789 [Xylariaceae sp. FL1651]|nr:hypothetical protein F5Y19DRAFT_431789 [Xylariaceae sp. FL1651]
MRTRSVVFVLSLVATAVAGVVSDQAVLSSPEPHGLALSNAAARSSSKVRFTPLDESPNPSGPELFSLRRRYIFRKQTRGTQQCSKPVNIQFTGSHLPPDLVDCQELASIVRKQPGIYKITKAIDLRPKGRYCVVQRHKTCAFGVRGGSTLGLHMGTTDIWDAIEQTIYIAGNTSKSLGWEGQFLCEGWLEKGRVATTHWAMLRNTVVGSTKFHGPDFTC